MSPRQSSRPPLTPEEHEAREHLRQRSLHVSTFCLHSMAWILAAFYATDYLPPLAIRFTVGLRQAAATQYLVGYLVLAAICLLLATAFGWFYGPRVRASRYVWRWYLFPVLVAVLLMPSQGISDLLTKAVEVVCLVPGIALGVALSRDPRWRGRWRPARGRVAAP
ncbi:MAG: hypothetical protein ACREOA_05970 [Candidatus Dormibacteria bacterium]